MSDRDVAPMQADRRLSTGIDGLDEILAGGLPAGRTYVVEGKSGVGKTTFALQFLLAGAARRERCLLFTLSEQEEELEQVARSHGWDLSSITIHSAVNAELVGATEQSVFGPAHVELTEWMKDVHEAVEAVAPDRMVLDSVTALRLMAGTPMHYRRQILALKADLAARGTTLVLVDHPEQGTEDAYLASLAHGIIDLESRPPPMGPVRYRIRVRKMRAMDFASGFHDYAILKGGLRVFPQLPVVPPDVPDAVTEQLSTGIPDLDALLHGGLDRALCTELVGPSGVGKSTLALQCALEMAGRGERTLLCSMEERERNFLSRAHRMHLDPTPLRDRGLLQIRFYEPTRLNPDTFNHEVRVAVERDGVRMVVLDSVAALLGGVPDERHLGILLFTLVNYLKRAGVTVLLVVPKRGFPGSAQGARGLELSPLADTVLLLRYFEHAGRLGKALSVFKRRGGPHSRAIHELILDDEGVRIGPPLVDLHAILGGQPSSVPADAPEEL